jgi:hypothetical protein
VFLTEKVNTTDLAKLNPVVTELIGIREDGENLKFIPADKDGNFDKDNIQSFVDVKKRVRSFRARVKDVAKQMKEEPAKITKAIIAIEKTFIDEATVVYDNAEKEFDVYIKAEDEKAKAKQEAKNKALLDAVDEASKAKEEANLKLKVSEIYNKIKYDIITKSIVENVSEALLNANEARLKELNEEINKTSYSSIVEDIDISILAQEVHAELQEFYLTARSRSIKLINEKLAAIAIEKKNVLLENENAKFVSHSSAVPNLPPVQEKEPSMVDPLNDIDQWPDNVFIDYIFKEANKLLFLTSDRIQKKPHSNPKIYDLRNLLYRFKQ